MVAKVAKVGGDRIQIDTAQAASALAWWLESGVDVAVQDEPRNWLKPPPGVSAPAGNLRAPSPEAFASALETLELFQTWLSTSPALPMAALGSKRILPSGPENAPVMLIAETPAAEDAAENRPIGGQAWQLVERMLAAIGVEASEAYIANLSCFHAPGARLSRDELAQCAEIARRHIALAKPRRLLLLGDGPSGALLGKPATAARGHVHKVEGVRTIVTFHPRTLIDYPENKRRAWEDLLLLMEDEV